MIIRKYFILSLSALMLAGCAGDEVVNNGSSTDERLPLRLEATLSGNRPVTRAVGSEFETGDVLYSYVRHVYSTTDLASATSYELASQASLVEFEKGSDAMVVVNTSTNSTSNLTPGKALYWDDFSNASVSTDNLRQDNHGLQSYYGYCYNGGTPTESLNTTTTPTGVLVWTTAADQSAKDAMKHNDLLWSPAQTPVVYEHGSSKDDDHNTITVPYTHAMSKFTIVVEAKDGFKDGDLKNTVVTLNEVSEVGTFDAPKGEVSASGSINVTMCPDGNTSSTTRTYQAVTVPHTKLEKDKVLATITDAGGNNYEIKVTENMLSSWDAGIENAASKSGVNYQLNVKLKKQAISVSATLADWTTVTADGNGEIQFEANVGDLGSNYENVKAGDSFALWMAKAGTDFGTDAATLVTYDADANRFTNNTAVYWPDGTTQFNFRALAKQTDSHLLEAVSTLKITKDDNSKLPDLLWGTSGASAIAPRTGDVPLTFSHAMSNVSVTLETSTDDKTKVDLEKASIKITNLKTEGTIDIDKGGVAAVGEGDDVVVDGETIMVPQEFSSNAKLVITLVDKTTYSLKLSNITAIPKWEGGNKYIYTIHLEKEEMKFRAVIEEWKTTTGSGTADLDWDD